MVIRQETRILVPDTLSQGALDLLSQQGYTVDFQPDLPQGELKEVIWKYDGVIVRSGKKIKEEELRQSGQLQVIARAGVGVDNIDVDSATKKGIYVLNTPNGNTNAVAELVMGQMIAMARNTHAADLSVRAGQWNRSRFGGVELRGKQLGIIGFGNIGRAVTLRALAFGMKVAAFDANPAITDEVAEREGARLVSFDELLQTSDFLTMHIPLTPKTKNLINADVLERVKPGMRIINTSRGGIIDEEALAEAVNNDRVAGAALDVFENEGAGKIPRFLLDNPKILLTPHLGASTEEAQDEVAREAAQGIIDILDGRFPSGIVNLTGMRADSYRKLMPYIPVAESIANLAAWLSEGQRITEVVANFHGITEQDLRPLRAALVGGLLSGFTDQTVNMVNCAQVEKETGIKISELRGENDEAFLEVTLRHKTGTSVLVRGVRDHEARAKVSEVNGYPVGFSIGDNPLLVCTNIDQPGMIADVAAFLGKTHGINITSASVGSRRPEDGSAMMVFTLKRGLTVAEESSIKTIPGILSAAQFTP